MSAPNVAAAELWLRELDRTGDPERGTQLVRELTRELATLEVWLERGWTWCQKHRDQIGTHHYGVREDHWLERLKLYERIFDAVSNEGRRAA